MRRLLVLSTTLLGVSAAAAAIAGCPATGIIGVAPITAVSIPISTVLSEANLGCGEGDDDVYKYAVVVAYSGGPEAGPPSFLNCPDSQFFGAVFDCFASATFANLPLQDAGDLLLDSGGALPDGGSVSISAWVALYNKRTYDHLGKRTIDQALAKGEGNGVCGLYTTWSTTCTATEEDNVLSTAACLPLALGTMPPPTSDAAPPLEGAPGDVSAEAVVEGSMLDAGLDAPLEGSAEAGPEPSPEAGADGGTEGGADAHIDAPPG